MQMGIVPDPGHGGLLCPEIWETGCRATGENFILQGTPLARKLERPERCGGGGWEGRGGREVYGPVSSLFSF